MHRLARRDLARQFPVFGVGLGYRETEFDAFGVPKGQRVRRFEQCRLDVVRRLWTEDKVSFENDILQASSTRPRPADRCRSPAIRRSGSPPTATPRCAAPRASATAFFINPHATMAVITGQMALYRAELARHGKPFPTVLPYLR